MSADEFDPPPPPRRRRLHQGAQDSASRFPRPLVVAAIVIVAVGALLFWPRGGWFPDRGRGSGQWSVVPADSSGGAAPPRSGEVDLGGARLPLVAETPDPRGKAAPRPLPRRIVEETPRGDVSAPAVAAGEVGDFALQVGSYSEEGQARLVCDELIAKGHRAHIRAASTGESRLVHRVWIGYFTDRIQAEAYARTHAADLGQATPVHR